VDDQHLAGLGPFDVDAAAGWVASGELAGQRFTAGVVVEPRSPVDLRPDLELLAGLNVAG